MSHFFKAVIFLIGIFNFIPFYGQVYAEPIPVFVSILPQKYFVERIGGNEVNVEVMVNPGESPATFNPNPKKMSRLAQAKLYFSIGVPFESIWIDRIHAIQPNLKFVPLHENTHEKLENDHGHNPLSDHSHGYGDPHIWTSPAKVKIMAHKITSTLVRFKPQRKKYFEENLQSFIRELEKLDRDIREIFSKSTNRRFMVFHPAWTYFAKDYGLEQVSIEEGGKEPGPRALQRIIEKGKKLEIKVIFVQKQFGFSIAKKIANMIGATVREMDPLKEDYMNNMRETAQAISGALQ